VESSLIHQAVGERGLIGNYGITFLVVPAPLSPARLSNAVVGAGRMVI
jgi:hypothetical protein